VREFFRATIGGGWMPPEVTAGLLRCYGIPLAGSTAPGGTEVVVRVEDDHLFGPLVVFGLGGAATELLADRAARLTPLTDVDADQLIRSIRGAPLLLGQDGSPGVDVGALRDLLLRVSRLADDLPEVTELDLSPVIARADGLFVAGARVRAAPYRPQDPFLRKLR
jgi:acyl-CoA synthetase (NDP forming)